MGAVGAAVAAAVASAVASKLLAPKPPKPETPAAVPKQQAEQTADVSAFKKDAAGAGLTGQQSTLLTGLGGVDKTQLNLGKNTFLGQ